MIRLAIALLLGTTTSNGADDDFLQWNAKQAKNIALSGRVSGQAGKSLDFRVLATDRSFNFKLRATWLTPLVIKALAKLEQTAKALSAAETQKLVADAIAAGDIILQIEIDPREGSGIIPLDWVALLGPRQGERENARVVRGINTPSLRKLPALAAVAPRDYSYELFWLVFPKTSEDGSRVFSPSDTEAELSVRIQGKVGKVRMPVPEYLR